jgi:hypothetical protein
MARRIGASTTPQTSHVPQDSRPADVAAGPCRTEAPRHRTTATLILDTLRLTATASMD